MNYKKTFAGSIVAFILSFSCCWLSSLAIGFGGIAFLNAIQVPLGLIGGGLTVVTVILFLRRK